MQHDQLRRSLAGLASAALLGGLVLATTPLASAATVPLASAAADPVGDLLAQFPPGEEPSAAGERLLREMAGLVGPPPAAGRRSAPAADSLDQPAAPGDPIFGTDTIVNDVTDDNLVTDNTTQSETALAVLDDTVCAGYNDFTAGGLSGHAVSSNGGATWTDLDGIGGRGDPVIAAHAASGDFFYGEIATIGGNPAIGIARSTDGCQTFAAAVNAAPVSSGLAGTTLNDKPWVAVDNTGGPNDGTIYVCWTRFFQTTPGDATTGTSEMRFSRSTNSGATFIGEQVIVPTGSSAFGCSIQVGSNGEIYVGYANRADDEIEFRRSLDGGVSFDPIVDIDTDAPQPGDATTNNCGTGNTRPVLNGNIRMLHGAWLAVDTSGGPDDGTIYAAWMENPADATDRSDVMVARSVDQGEHWVDVQQLGGGNNVDQFNPYVSVSATGAVAVAWYDRRNDTANNLLTDVYTAYSSDGGAGYGALIRVSDVSAGIPPLFPHYNPGTAQCYFGEYLAVAGDVASFHYFWGDGRRSIVTTGFPSGRLDLDVYYDRLEAPVLTGGDLRVSKTSRPDPAIAGEELYYDVTVTNFGPNTVFNAVVTDELPDGVNFVTSTVPCTEAPVGTLTCEVGDVEAFDSVTFTIKVHVDPDILGSAEAITIYNTVSVAADNDTDTRNNTFTLGTIVEDRADLEINKLCKPDTRPRAGQPIRCTIFVDNHGPSDARDVVVTDTMLAPGAFTVSAITPSQGSCGPATPVTGGQQFDCNLGNLEVATPAQSGRATITYILSSNEGQDINNVATVRSDTPDPVAANNRAVVTLTIESVADLSLTKSDAPDPVIAGTSLTWTLTLTNNGPSSASNVTVADDVPAGVTVTSISGSGGAVCHSGSPGDPLLPATCEFGTVPSGGSRTMTIVALVGSGTKGTLQNNARVSSDTFDDNNANDLAATTTTVALSADLALTFTSEAPTAKPSTTIHYKVTVDNLGPSDADGVVVTVKLPPLKSGYYVSDNGGCTLSNVTLTCPLGTIVAGSPTRTIFIDWFVQGSKFPVVATASVASPTPDPVLGNNSATVSVAKG